MNCTNRNDKSGVEGEKKRKRTQGQPEVRSKWKKRMLTRANLILQKYDGCSSVHCRIRHALLVCRLHEGKVWGCCVTCYIQCFAQGSYIVNISSKKAMEHRWCLEAKKERNIMVQFIMWNCFEVTSTLRVLQRGLARGKHVRAGRGHLWVRMFWTPDWGFCPSASEFFEQNSSMMRIIF